MLALTCLAGKSPYSLAVSGRQPASASMLHMLHPINDIHSFIPRQLWDMGVVSSSGSVSGGASSTGSDLDDVSSGSDSEAAGSVAPPARQLGVTRASVAHRHVVAKQHRDTVPDFLLCPITGMPFTDPVVAADGRTYERSAIKAYIKQHKGGWHTGAGSKGGHAGEGR